MFAKAGFPPERPDLWEASLPLEGKRQSNRQHGSMPQKTEIGVNDGRNIVIQSSQPRVDIILSRNVDAFGPSEIPSMADSKSAFAAALAVAAGIARASNRELSRVAVAVEAFEEFEGAPQALGALLKLHPTLPLDETNMEAEFMRSHRQVIARSDVNLIERWRLGKVQTALLQVSAEGSHPVAEAATRHVLQLSVEMNTAGETALSLQPDDAISLISEMTSHVNSIIETSC